MSITKMISIKFIPGDITCREHIENHFGQTNSRKFNMRQRELLDAKHKARGTSGKQAGGNGGEIGQCRPWITRFAIAATQAGLRNSREVADADREPDVHLPRGGYFLDACLRKHDE